MADLTTTPSGIWVLQALLGVEKMPTALRLRPFVPSIDGGGTVATDIGEIPLRADRRVRVARRGRGHRRTRSRRRGGAGLDGRGRPAAAGSHGRHPATQADRRHCAARRRRPRARGGAHDVDLSARALAGHDRPQRRSKWCSPRSARPHSADAQVELISDTVLHAFAAGRPAAISGFNLPSAALETGAHRHARQGSDPSSRRR